MSKKILQIIALLAVSLCFLSKTYAQQGPPIVSAQIDSLTTTDAHLSWSLSFPAVSATITYSTDTGLVSTTIISPPAGSRVAPTHATIPRDSSANFEIWTLKVTYPDGSNATDALYVGLVIVAEDIYSVVGSGCGGNPSGTEYDKMILTDMCMYISFDYTCGQEGEVISDTILQNGTYEDSVNVWVDFAKDVKEKINAELVGPGEAALIPQDICQVIEDGGIGARTAVYNEVHLATVYPNPASKVLVVQSSYNLDLHNLRIQNIAGQTVLAMSEAQLDSRSQRVDIQHLSPGLYIVEVTGEGWSERIKFVKK